MLDMIEPLFKEPKPEGIDITDCFSAHNTIWDELRICARMDKIVFEI